MKIVYFTDSLLSSIAGISNSLINLSMGLKRNGHLITIVAPDSSSQTYKKSALKGISLSLFPSIESPWNPRLRIGSPLSPKLFSKIRKIAPDILHFHTPFLIGASAVVLGRSLKKPIIGTFHSYFMQPEYLKSAGINVQTNSLTNFLWKYAAFFYNQCDAVIAPSETVKKDLKKYGIKKPIHIISNPINVNQFKIVESKRLTALKTKLKLSQKVILYVGRFSYEKSLDILLKSFAKVAKEADNTSLLLIGDGPIKSELKTLAKDLKIKDKVVFAGPIAQKILLSSGYFQLADTFVTASGSETQGITLIEAMYFGLPLVGIAKKGTSDMIKNVGLLSPPHRINALAKNILRVLTDKTLHQQLRITSRKTFAQKYASQKIIKQVEDLYKDLSKTS